MEAGFKAPNLDKNSPVHKLPVEHHKPTHAPEVPPPITRKHAAHVIVDVFTTSEELPMTLGQVNALSECCRVCVCVCVYRQVMLPLASFYGGIYYELPLILYISYRHPLMPQKYPVWTFNGKTPGPIIRCRVGDTLEIR